MNEDGKSKPDYKRRFGKNLKKYRELENMSQAELAIAADCTSQYISKAENLKANLTMDSMLRLSDGVKRDFLEMIQE